MIDRQNFNTKLYKKIMNAMRLCDSENVIDMRLFKNENNLYDGEFSIFDIDDLYNAIKDCDVWFIDFYENIKSSHSAEYMDISLFSSEFKEEYNLTPMFNRYDDLSLAVNQYEDERRKQVTNIVEALQKNKRCEYLCFTDKTSYPIFYNDIAEDIEYIVGAKAVNGILYITTDPTFDSESWFNWMHYGKMNLDEFVYILQHNLA